MIEYSLNILDVMDRGVPNKERIPIEVVGATNLSRYWIGIGIRTEPRRILPINDNLLWLGQGEVLPGDWVFVYTGQGSPQQNNVPNSVNKIFTIHWNRRSVLFQSEELQPFLINGIVSFYERPESDTNQS